MPGDKEIYKIIKSLNQKDLKYLTDNLKAAKNPKIEQGSYEVNLTVLNNPENPNKPFFILKDFELVREKIGKAYLKGKYPRNKERYSEWKNFIGKR